MSLKIRGREESENECRERTKEENIKAAADTGDRTLYKRTVAVVHH